jgi:hypothetical protein
MVSTTSPSYFLQPVKISLAKRSDETNSLPPIDSSIKIDPRNKKTKNNNRVVGIDGSSEGFPADDKCHDDQDQDKQPIRNTRKLKVENSDK